MRKNLTKTKSNFSIQSFEGGYDKNYSYLLTCLETISPIIIDASLESSKLKPFIKSRPTAMLITHSHHDHIKYINEYIEKYCQKGFVPSWLNEPDLTEEDFLKLDFINDS